MPIKFDRKTFEHWRQAARYVMRKKHFSKERANRYVAGIERRQRKGVRFRPS